MAKKVIAEIKLQIPAGQANPSPPVGPALGQRGVNIMEFCKSFNAQTQAQSGLIIPVIITVYADRSFTFITKTPPAAVLLKRAAGVEKGSGETGKKKVGQVTRKQVEEIARLKMPDLTAADVEQAMKTIEGTARSLGLDVVQEDHGEAQQALREGRGVDRSGSALSARRGDPHAPRHGQHAEVRRDRGAGGP